MKKYSRVGRTTTYLKKGKARLENSKGIIWSNKEERTSKESQRGKENKIGGSILLRRIRT